MQKVFFKISTKMHFMQCFHLLSMGFFALANCQTLGDLPVDVLGDLLSTIIYGTVQVIGDCDGSDNGAPATNYWIYTTDNADTPTIVTQPSTSMCGGRTKIIFLAHGWVSDANAPYIIGLKDAYLSRYGSDVCIVAVNWDTYANKNYLSAYCALPGVGTNVANFICELSSTLNINLESIHVVGHSMGAQVFGLAGKYVQVQCGKIGRITGLDPAGPLYDGIATGDRLDPSDATFVDVIHTNQGEFGFLGSCGHLDAYANCGFFQPGCLKLAIEDILQNITAVLNLPKTAIFCNHRRSCDYFQESIKSDSFVAKPCLACVAPVCLSKLFSTERKVIGEDCTSAGGDREYVFYTNSVPPYARG